MRLGCCCVTPPATTPTTSGTELPFVSTVSVNTKLTAAGPGDFKTASNPQPIIRKTPMTDAVRFRRFE